MAPAIRFETVGKRYLVPVGADRSGYRTLRESLSGLARRTLARCGRGGLDTTEFWALQGVSFTVEPGEVVGIIGRNGSGKSTLLKILSRITRPTTGQVALRGRVGSLLEVGTGFHPELTGRENVYLNGAILGMTRHEITRKFDAIVAFAEVDTFLDMPVKRYSSGMYVRLAFAVAAHLEPDILVVDEVLAVGDVQFQKKCLGKLQELTGEGRTVILVTHNMPVVLQLCSRAVLLDSGQVTFDGPSPEAAQRHLAGGLSRQEVVCDLASDELGRTPRGRASLLTCRLLRPAAGGPWALDYGSPVELEIDVHVREPLPYLELGLALCNATGCEVASSLSCDATPLGPADSGPQRFTVAFPSLCLAPGRYYFGLGLRSHSGMEHNVPEAVHFEVLPTEESARLSVHLRRGAVIPELRCLLTPRT